MFLAQGRQTAQRVVQVNTTRRQWSEAGGGQAGGRWRRSRKSGAALAAACPIIFGNLGDPSMCRPRREVHRSQDRREGRRSADRWRLAGGAIPLNRNSGRCQRSFCCHTGIQPAQPRPTLGAPPCDFGGGPAMSSLHSCTTLGAPPWRLSWIKSVRRAPGCSRTSLRHGIAGRVSAQPGRKFADFLQFEEVGWAGFECRRHNLSCPRSSRGRQRVAPLRLPPLQSHVARRLTLTRLRCCRGAATRHSRRRHQ